MANLLPFEVTMMATKGHFALFLVAQASTFLSLRRRGKDGWADLDSRSASSGQGPQSLFAHLRNGSASTRQGLHKRWLLRVETH